MAIAHLLFWFGIMRVSFDILVAFRTDTAEANQAAAQAYLTAATTGEAINIGILYVLLGVALGVLCEISGRRSKAEDVG
ncbi:hypothetical protein [Paragemmobacter straminiformis]|uniref:Uncharacterized protein n=1 Tax=Paragemmobacter straminiformis TaxID=2045119 RepID=A0A842I7U5_9RHOB|nr:hypothetical protein [Gemmobacter straminiformis]MBC2835144.1 hypothetical protein [Gemmobacter straminiformis]